MRDWFIRLSPQIYFTMVEENLEFQCRRRLENEEYSRNFDKIVSPWLKKISSFNALKRTRMDIFISPWLKKIFHLNWFSWIQVGNIDLSHNGAHEKFLGCRIKALLLILLLILLILLLIFLVQEEHHNADGWPRVVF